MFVRTASERDVDAVRALLVETLHATFDSIHGYERVAADLNERHSLAALSAQVARPDSEFILADDGHEIGGMAFASVRDGGKTVLLEQLFVRPAFQGRGIGGLLLDEIIDSFPDGVTIELDIETENARAVAFCKAQGFVAISGESAIGAQTATGATLRLEKQIV